MDIAGDPVDAPIAAGLRTRAAARGSRNPLRRRGTRRDCDAREAERPAAAARGPAGRRAGTAGDQRASSPAEQPRTASCLGSPTAGSVPPRCARAGPRAAGAADPEFAAAARRSGAATGSATSARNHVRPLSARPEPARADPTSRPASEQSASHQCAGRRRSDKPRRGITDSRVDDRRHRRPAGLAGGACRGATSAPDHPDPARIGDRGRRRRRRAADRHAVGGDGPAGDGVGKLRPAAGGAEGSARRRLDHSVRGRGWRSSAGRGPAPGSDRWPAERRASVALQPPIPAPPPPPPPDDDIPDDYGEPPDPLGSVGAVRDPEEIAIALLSAELGARRLDPSGAVG